MFKTRGLNCRKSQADARYFRSAEDFLPQNWPQIVRNILHPNFSFEQFWTKVRHIDVVWRQKNISMRGPLGVHTWSGVKMACFDFQLQGCGPVCQEAKMVVGYVPLALCLHRSNFKVRVSKGQALEGHIFGQNKNLGFLRFKGKKGCVLVGFF